MNNPIDVNTRPIMIPTRPFPEKYSKRFPRLLNFRRKKHQDLPIHRSSEQERLGLPNSPTASHHINISLPVYSNLISIVVACPLP